MSSPRVSRRSLEAAERFNERRRREDDAPRLLDLVPELKSCRLELKERRVDLISTIAHTRLIVVERAPALFFFVCGDPSCQDGGHDLTPELLRALQRRTELVTGTHLCQGSVRGTECRRLLEYTMHAEYVARDGSG